MVLYYQQHPPDNLRDALATGSGETKKKLLYRKRYGVWNHAQQLVVNPVGNDLGERALKKQMLQGLVALTAKTQNVDVCIAEGVY